MKILVTGGNGFIGSKYCREIEKLGHAPIVYDLPRDICRKHEFSEAASLADMVVHFAAMADVTVCIKELDKNHDVNVNGTYNVAKVCMEQNKPLIFISTCCVYGNSMDDDEVEFKTAPMCCEPYATSKVAGEAIIRGMPNLKWVILRIGTVFGPGMREALFTHIALNNIIDDKTVYIDGDGLQTRQLVYIDDLVDGIVRATKKFNDITGEIINLCGKEETSAIDTVDIAEIVTNQKAKRVHRQQRYGQTFEEHISIEKAKRLLDWEPKMSFLDGMKLSYEWLSYVKKHSNRIA